MGLFDAAEAALAGLAVRVAALEGGTVEPPVEPPPVTYTPSGEVRITSGAALSTLSWTGLDVGVWGEGSVGASISDCRADGCRFGIKIGSGPTTRGLSIARYISTDTRIPLFLADTEDATITDLDLAGRVGTNGDHCIYMERGNKRLTGRNWNLRHGADYCLHFYDGTFSGTYTSEDIDLEHITLDATGGGHYPLCIIGYRRVTIRDLTMIGTADGPCIMLKDCQDVLIEDFAAQGGYSLVYSHGGVSGVTIRNGSYPGTKPLISGVTSGVTFEGVTR